MKRRQRKGISQPDPYRKHFIILFGGIGVLFIVGLLYVVGKYFFVMYVSQNTIIENPVVSSSQSIPFQVLFEQADIEYTKVVDLEGGNVVSVEIENGPEVLFSGTTDREGQIALLKSILNKLEIENKKATVIDLRFSKPIVKF